METPLQIIGRQLKAARKDLDGDNSQKHISEKLKIPRSTISSMENGSYEGSINRLERYLEFLGFEVSISPMSNKLPQFDDLESIFGDD